MALVLLDRCQQTASSNTTVSFTLTGAVTGFQSLAGVGNGNTTYYSAFDASGNWETGLGTYSTTGPTLTRTTVYASSNSGSAVTFSGTVNVFVTYPSGKSVNLDASGNVTALGTITSGVWNGTTIPVAYGGTGITSPGTAGNLLTSNGTAWVSSAPAGSTIYTRTAFTATAAQTTFSVTYTVGYVEVYVNGTLLNAADYTATNGTSIVLAQGRATGDIVETIAFNSFSVANTVSSFSGGTTGLTPSTGTTGNVTLGGTLAVANGGTGVTTSTGSGAVVLGTSPTIATPTITSLYGQNSNLVTTPYRDAGLIPAELIYRLNTAVVGANVGTPQSLLGVGVTVVASTVYQFEAVIALSKSAGTTNSYIQFLFGGTATVNNIAYAVNWEFDATSFGTSANVGQVVYIQVATAAQVSFANTTAAVYYKAIVKGTVSINAGGTFIPQYQQSTASGGAYTTAIGSYFKLSPLGASGSNTSIGTWA